MVNDPLFLARTRANNDSMALAGRKRGEPVHIISGQTPI
jgi:hypothetical protein